MSGVFPLWKKDTRELVRLVETSGIEAVIVCVNEKYLGKEFLGRKVNADLLNDLPANVDPCGENGEYHSFVYNAPIFTAPIAIQTGEVVHKCYTGSDGSWDTGFYFMDVTLK
jgi:diphthamide synthase (EF-2-diphthine--ammonia ligase)